MAVDLEALIQQAKQLPASQRVRLIAELSADMVRTQDPSLFQEQNRIGRSSKTLKQILEEQGVELYDGSSPQVWPEDEDVDEFIEWRRRERAASRRAQISQEG